MLIEAIETITICFRNLFDNLYFSMYGGTLQEEDNSLTRREHGYERPVKIPRR